MGTKEFYRFACALVAQAHISLITRLVSILFERDFNVIIFLYGWGPERCLGVWVKIFGVCRYAFL